MKLLRHILDRIVHLGGFGCTDTEQLLFDYSAGSLAAETRHKLEKHLANCPGCVRFVKSYQQTIAATHSHGLPEVEMPRELRARLHEFIQQNPQLR